MTELSAIASAAPPNAQPKASAASAQVLDKIRQGIEEGSRLASDLRTKMGAARKGLAREAVERIKKQLGDLALFATTSPKAVARLTKFMSQQLATATEAYAKDGPSGADADTAFARDAETLDRRVRLLAQSTLRAITNNDEHNSIVKSLNENSKQTAKFISAIRGWSYVAAATPATSAAPASGSISILA